MGRAPCALGRMAGERGSAQRGMSVRRRKFGGPGLADCGIVRNEKVSLPRSTLLIPLSGATLTHMVGRALFAAAIGCAVMIALAGCTSSSESLPWSLAQSSPSASTVVVQYYFGTCDTLTGARVKHTDSTVSITLNAKSHGDACDDALRMSYVRVRLGQPLGNRKIVGACSPGVHQTCQPTRPAAIPTGLRLIGP